ncbi:hypothetical protein [Polaromonas sp. A23]|uniref:hypothetical protein n=1 Tax=Polaromonas sp. A23 TaxID=1944133 RepID=UPI0011158A3A|nr:hypothetical protein [Polaromonas sp. A23]
MLKATGASNLGIVAWNDNQRIAANSSRIADPFFLLLQSEIYSDGPVRITETAPHQRLTAADAFTHFIRSLFVNKWLNTFSP